jgi:membrane protease YdiL (CAAX protease family)
MGIGALLVLGGLVYGVVRVMGLEGGELERMSDWVHLEPTTEEGVPQPHLELLRADLRQGEDVTFEVCSQGPLVAGDWEGVVELVVWHPEDQEVVVRAPMDAALLARSRRSARGACLVLARGEDLPIAGTYAIEAVWQGHALPEAIQTTPLRARIIAHRPLRTADRWPVFAVLLGALLLVVGASRWRTDGMPIERPEEPAAAPRGVPLRILVGLCALLGVGVLSAFVPIWGATAAVGRGLTIAAVEVVAALLLVGVLMRPGVGRGDALGLVRPERAVWALAVAPAAGLFLWFVGGIVMRLVPATGEAPIETLVTWPSGTLAVGLVAVLVPVAEELFFRGFVFGAVARRYGGAAAFAITVLVFVLAHVPQDWGAWGALTGILLTGLGLTALRWWTGSTLVPALAHLVHNGVIVAISLAAS